MPDPAKQLQQIYVAGFELKVFDRFPKCVGIVRDNCIALLVPSPEGLQMLGTPGWLIGEAIGVLVESSGRKVFQAKPMPELVGPVWEPRPKALRVGLVSLG